jgi:hypothetical protein
MVVEVHFESIVGGVDFQVEFDENFESGVQVNNQLQK